MCYQSNKNDRNGGIGPTSIDHIEALRGKLGELGNALLEYGAVLMDTKTELVAM